MTFLMVDAVAPGQFRQLHVFERDDTADGDPVWRYYGLAVSWIKWFRPSPFSFTSRAEAYFRHLSGAPDASELRSQP